MQFCGIPLNMDWREGQALLIPALPGLYVEVLWPVHGIRIGQTQNIRARHSEALRWYRNMRVGTGRHPNRRGDLSDYAREHGADGLERFIISTHPALACRALRLEVEAHLHEWARQQQVWKDYNRERKLLAAAQEAQAMPPAGLHFFTV